MVLGLITAIPQIVQTVQGIAGAAKAAKGGGGDEAPKAAKAEKGGGAENAGDAKEGEGGKEAAIDRFLKMLDNPNVRTIQDIKGIRDKVMDAIQKNGMKPEDAENARKKLNQAILKKLGIAKPGQDGKLEVDLNPRNAAIIQQLGMKPDQVKPAGGAQGPAPQAPPQAPVPARGAPVPS